MLLLKTLPQQTSTLFLSRLKLNKKINYESVMDDSRIRNRN